MLIDFALLVAGMALLVWSADRFTDGAAAVARNMGVSPLLIGLTIVAIGSSAPEISTSIVASLDGKSQLVIGNALGSNIANVAMVLGITALIRPLQVQSKTLKREIPILFVVMAIAGLLLMDLKLTLLDGLILMITLAVYFGWLIREGVRERKSKDRMLEEIIEELPGNMSTAKAVFWVIVGLILLPTSSDWMVTGASGLAREFGVSDLVIGLTIVAIGTSLPELAASCASVLRNEHEIAIGNVIGSNIFNLLAVLGIPGLISAVPVSPEALYRDFPLMAGLAISAAIMAYGFRGKAGRINRLEGFVLLSIYLVYIVYLYYSATL